MAIAKESSVPLKIIVVRIGIGGGIGSQDGQKDKLHIFEGIHRILKQIGQRRQQHIDVEMHILQQIDKHNKGVTAPDHHHKQHSYQQPTDNVYITICSLTLLLLGSCDT